MPVAMGHSISAQQRLTELCWGLCQRESRLAKFCPGWHPHTRSPGPGAYWACRPSLPGSSRKPAHSKFYNKTNLAVWAGTRWEGLSTCRTPSQIRNFHWNAGTSLPLPNVHARKIHYKVAVVVISGGMGNSLLYSFVFSKYSAMGTLNF